MQRERHCLHLVARQLDRRTLGTGLTIELHAVGVQLGAHDLGHRHGPVLPAVREQTLHAAERGQARAVLRHCRVAAERAVGNGAHHSEQVARAVLQFGHQHGLARLHAAALGHVALRRHPVPHVPLLVAHRGDHPLDDVLAPVLAVVDRLALGRPACGKLRAQPVQGRPVRPRPLQEARRAPDHLIRRIA